ncbi:conserved exported hypothetical protein [metagenome]|uniref:Uncharacterized protein n=1 Tax=metagenome TaxID=256318 RepID=A0A2P2C1F9_9ZZZZ
MHRNLAAVVGVATLTASLLAPVSVDAAAMPSIARPSAERALATATSVLAGEAAPQTDATMALLGLRAAYDDLSPHQRVQADRVVARPTRDDVLCGVRVCVHYTRGSTGDRTTQAWAEQTLATMDDARDYIVHHGFRRGQASDLLKGGNGKLDVYTENLRDEGHAGYCQTETQVVGEPRLYSGFCVFDNDFEGYAEGPKRMLRITAAHEIFHAVEFNYDTFEDPWIMEASANWMTDEYLVDGVGATEPYLDSLAYGQLGKPRKSLDRASGRSPAGNWIFIERVSRKLSYRGVRNIWERLDATTGAPNASSIKGVKQVLAAEDVAFRGFYTRFAADNRFPHGAYHAGDSYEPTKPAKTFRLAAAEPSARASVTLDHLSSTSYVFTPGASLSGSWRLRLTVNGPRRAEGTGAYVQVVKRRSGVLVDSRPISIDKGGDGTVVASLKDDVPYRVIVTLANAGTQYTCAQGTTLACQGVSKNDDNRFVLTARAVR